MKTRAAQINLIPRHQDILALARQKGYLSTEELFGSLDEPFRKHIDDPQKGKLAVRADDGTHFTPTGLRMISARLVEAITTGRTP